MMNSKEIERQLKRNQINTWLKDRGWRFQRKGYWFGEVDGQNVRFNMLGDREVLFEVKRPLTDEEKLMEPNKAYTFQIVKRVTWSAVRATIPGLATLFSGLRNTKGSEMKSDSTEGKE